MFRLQDLELTDRRTWPPCVQWGVAVFVCVVMVGGGSRYAIAPEWAALRHLQQQEAAHKQTFRTHQQQVQHLPLLRVEVGDLDARVAELLNQLPDNAEVPALLVDISQAGLARQLTFQQFKPAPLQTETFYQILPIALTAHGTFHQFAAFIDDLTRLTRLVSVDAVLITRDPAKPLRLEAELHTYQYQPTAKVAP